MARITSHSLLAGGEMGNRRQFLRAAALGAAWPALARGQAKGKKPEGILVNDLHGQLSATWVYRIVQPDTLDGVRAALRLALAENRALCICGGRHSMGSQAFAADGVLVDTRKLAKMLVFDQDRGLIEVEAGMQWPALLETLRQSKWAFNQKQSGVDRVSMGGSLSANMHGHGLTLPPFVSDIESFKLLNARGQLLNCSRSENTELFRLAIGGYGLFGLIYSVTLRLVPRRKVERIVEVRNIEGLAGAFADRVRDGYLYGDFQCAIDEKSPDFLRRGVFSCYRPVGDEREIPDVQRELGEADWTQLLYLAHADKAEAFKRYSNYSLATSGQLYGSDEHQMSYYPENYHREIDRKTAAEHRANDVITEMYGEREALEAFMSELRAYVLRGRTEIVSATIGLIEQDQESFLAWARRPYACVTLNVHVERTSTGLIRAADALRGLIDIGLRYGGSYYPAYHRYAVRRQIDACFPQFQDFLKLKRKYDPSELFQSDWYRHYKKMYFG
jgi:FAD/FMN-containing dehydrogenase